MLERVFFMTDVEGSTRLWVSHPEVMPRIVSRLDELIDEVVVANGGRLVKARGEGDSHFAVFEDERRAMAAGFLVRERVRSEAWPAGLQVLLRMAIASGPVNEIAGDYYGTTVNRCARMRSAASGGQLLAGEEVVHALNGSVPAGARLRPRGIHVLRDVPDPVALFEVCGLEEPDDPRPLRTLEARAHNLPLTLTGLVGRDEEIVALVASLRRHRLVTIVGPPGVGKTRLAIAVGETMQDLVEEGVWWVDLAAVRPGMVAEAVGLSLGCQGSLAEDGVASVAERVRGREIVLILDNAEHVRDEVASAARALLAASPGLRVLSTSRASLGLPGEILIELGPLAVDGPGESQAVTLFRARAAEAGALDALEGRDELLLQICRALEGIPLGIELAARSLRWVGADDLLALLDQPLDLSAASGVDGRHASLRGAIRSSEESLTDEERVVFRRLAIFPGTFRLADARAVCGGGVDIVAAVRALVDRSLLARVPEDPSRYRLLVVLREYAAERLRATEGAEQLAGRHLDHYVEKIAQSSGSDIDEQLERRHDLPNYHAALERALAIRDPRMLDLCIRLINVWVLSGTVREATSFVEQCLASATDAPLALEGQLREFRARLEVTYGSMDQAEQDLRALLDRYRAGDPGPRRVSAVLRELAGIAAYRGELHAAAAALDEVLAGPDGRDPAVRVPTLVGHASALARHDPPAAVASASEGLALAAEHGMTSFVLRFLLLLAEAALDALDHDETRARAEEFFARADEVSTDYGRGHMKFILARTALDEGDTALSRALFDEAVPMMLDFDPGVELAAKGVTLRLIAGDGMTRAYRETADRVLALARVTEDERYAIEAFRSTALVAAAHGMPVEAVRLMAHAMRLVADLGPPMPQEVMLEKRAEHGFDAARLEHEKAIGRGWTHEQAVDVMARVLSRIPDATALP